MKRIVILLLAAGLIATAMAQQRPLPDGRLKDLAMKRERAVLETDNFSRETSNYVKSRYEEVTIGETRFDDQSNASIQNRLYLYDDGTFGAAWIYGLEDASFPDRGAGYNFSDGVSWGPIPDGRVEDERCGWPSYAPLGPDGEIIASHTSESGIKISSRPVKNTGDWSYQLFPGPAGNEKMLWPRLVTAGEDHNIVHMLNLTASSDYGGGPYQGLEGALLYSRSSDGGQTWEVQNEILPGMTSDDYAGFFSDTYTFAEPKDDIVAFVVGESWYDLFLMKSEDGGDNWEKTIIWEHPYPLWTSGTVTDTFYCSDGAHSVVIDGDGMVHVAFGINRAYADAGGNYWFPFVDGLGYWNEDMGSFSSNKNALNPYGHPDSELVENETLVAWTQDVDGDGEITFVGTQTENIGAYYLGLSSMPQLVLDDAGTLFLLFSSVTETFQTATQNYRHIWMRRYWEGAGWGMFEDLTGDITHIFDECVYPTCAANTTPDHIYMTFQIDTEPGLAVWGDMDAYTDNSIVFKDINKWGVGINEEQKNTGLSVSQNFPNPCREKTSISVNLDERLYVKVDILNVTGQKVRTFDYGYLTAGRHLRELDLAGLEQGIYFYTVTAGSFSETRQMVVH